MKYPDLRLLSQFLTVCEAQTMTAAAQQLHISTAAVSQALLRLENDLGVPLLERSPQGVRVTPAGAELREQARRLLDTAEETLEALKPYRSQAIPRLRMYVMESAASYLVPALITALDKAVGELVVNSGSNPNHVEDMLRGKLDILISTDEFQDIGTLEKIPLCREKLVAIVPASLAASERSVRALCEQLPLLRIMRGRRIDDLVSAYLDDAGLDPPRRVECSSAAPILELIGRGYGWTITTPLSVCYHNPRRDKVAWVALPDSHHHRDLYLIAEKGRLLDLPETLAKQCRRALHMEILQWRTSFEPLAAAAIRVLDGHAVRDGADMPVRA
jgi:DNA-binding transcriptional LysR family regulator